MIKNFDEYIKEGLWKTGFDRSKNNDIRKEDNDFIKWLKTSGVEEINFGLPSGNIWLSKNYGDNDLYLSPSEIKELTELLPSNYRIATYKDFTELFANTKYNWETKYKLRVCKYDKEMFLVCDGYILRNHFQSNVEHQLHYGFDLVDNSEYTSCSILTNNFIDVRLVNIRENVKFNIRIVKIKDD